MGILPLSPNTPCNPICPMRFPVDKPLSQSSLFETASRDVRRLREVFAVVSRHGFGEFILRSPLAQKLIRRSERKQWLEYHSQVPAPQRFKVLLEDLGPTFVKFGQVLSLRGDLIPQEFAEALEKLQDHARPFSYSEVAKAIENGLGGPIQTFYREIENHPIGSASISQAHRAVTLDGQKVVVKVQRPHIAEQMKGDLDILYILAKILEASIEEMQLLSPSDIVAQFEKGLLSELNFLAEAQNLNRAREFLSVDSKVIIPKIFPELCCHTILTMEYFEGRSLRNLPARMPETQAVIKNIVEYFIRQLVFHGFFHGDPHAGNILINSAMEPALIDFGLVGQLDENQREDMVSVMMGVLTQDTATIARMMLKIGTPTQRVNLQSLKIEISRFLNRHIFNKSLLEVDSKALAHEFLEAANHFRIKVSSDYVILFKALGTIEGLVRQMAPELDIEPIIRPIFEDFIKERFSSKDLLTDSMGGILSLRSFLKQIPYQVEQILHDAESGYTQIRLVAPEIERIAPILHAIAGRLTLSLFAVSMTAASVIMLTEAQPTRIQLIVGISSTIFSFFAWITLFWWHLMGRGRPLRVQSFLQFFRR
jgi:ubiquinone biosynthesis protein